MKYVKQFFIIIAVSFAGEVLKEIIPLNIPANIYGLIIMFAGLLTKVIKVSDVKETAGFLVKIMPLMFIPPGVGLMVSASALKNILVPFIIITISSTVIVMVVSGKVTQFVIKLDKKRGEVHERNNQ